MSKVEWADVSPEFGANMPHGSCAAIVRSELGVGTWTVCGFPRREDGSCTNGHPAQSTQRGKVEG